MTPDFERWTMRRRLELLGEHWDQRLRSEWFGGAPSAVIAAKYGLEEATIEALLPRTLKKRKPS